MVLPRVDEPVEPSLTIRAVMVLDRSSNDNLKYLSLKMSDRYLLRYSGTSFLRGHLGKLPF